ncbi:hypothetical protein LY01_02255 [Nonlabens xylanidelens]|uniref:Uncharacterized protein n=1 Tax=Nonlabens xylanidelens TaxID=191564 RepID=A0A2S6III1_9FLAO|nr:hypothetical protein [Nonlabens xylanidelens]PPK94033.1 hypothetical protein LY01_02255 [Nonlabens xylanidelens]PQJ22187.1 hypothetical protein BST94_00995 [Nonlabens xylanidelens]
MNVEDLVGIYNIKGHNQDVSQSRYEGILELSLDQHKRIIASWIISGNQLQKGTGFFKDNILVINFNYQNEEQEVFKGVVVYKCLSKDVLDGFWSEKHGHPAFLGLEQALRKEKNKLHLN